MGEKPEPIPYATPVPARTRTRWLPWIIVAVVLLAVVLFAFGLFGVQVTVQTMPSSPATPTSSPVGS